MVYTKYTKIRKAYLNKAIETKEYIAADSIYNSVSFRLQPTLKNDKLLFLRTFKEVIFSFFKKIKIHRSTEESTIAVLDCTFAYTDIRINYIKKLTNKNVKIIVNKNNLLGFTSFTNSIKILVTAVKLLSQTSFTKRNSVSRLNYALLIKELPELINFLHIIKKNKIKTVFDFANYEVDSNFLYLLLKDSKVEVYKVPSSGPLYMHNKNLLTDYLVISSAYQQEEIYNFSSTILYNKVLKFYPETSSLLYLQKQKNSSNNLNVFGFYSHASWIREKEKHGDNNLNLFVAEENLLKIIDKVFSNSNYKLIIFLHPKEKEKLQAAKKYYSEKLKNIKFEFSPIEKKTADCFHLCNIALVALSTILFERLFEGYKILIYKKDIKGFPSPNSALNKISFDNEIKLQELILKNNTISDEQFFINNEIVNYTKEFFIPDEYK